jgi:clan AA aspartic protease
MGIFSVRIEVGDPQGVTFEAVDALVDTGSTNTAVPGSVLQRLGVIPQYKDQFELADNSLIELDVGRTWVKVNGRQEFTQVVFAEEGTEPLLGMITLEEMGLGVDPIRQELVPVRKKRKLSLTPDS